MSELTELEEVMRSLKKDNVEKKRFVTELENEKKYLEERNRFLIEKLKQAGVLYEESGKRLTDFVNENLKPLKAKLAEFEALSNRTKEHDKSISAALKQINDFEVVIGSFRNEVVKNEERQAEISTKLSEMKKSHAEISKRISTVQTFGSEELGEKVEEIKAKFGEDVRKIGDQFSVLKLGVASSIDNFKKEFERQGNALRNEMEKVDIKKAKELSDALANTTAELNRTKADFARSIIAVEKSVESLDVRKTKETTKALEMLSANLEERFANLSDDLQKKVIDAQGDLNRFRIELEKTLGKAKADTRDFVDTKSKEFDSLLAELREKMNGQMQTSVGEWDKNLGALRSELVASKKEVEKLIGTINRKVEIGEERREKKIQSGFASMQALANKKIEAEIDQINGQIDDVARNAEDAKSELNKSIELLRKAFDTGEIKRQKDIDKIIKEFMVVKGEVDEKINEVSLEIGKFSKMAEALRRQVLKESLDGVHEKTKAIFGEMEKKFETVEDGLIDKIASLESDFDEFNAGFQATVSSLKAETDKKIDFLKKEFDKRDAARDREAAAFSKTLQKGIDVKFSATEGKMENRLNAAEDEITSLTKAIDNFTVELSEKFDSIIQAKTREFGKEVKTLVADMKAMEKGINLVISAFKSDIEKSELKKRTEIDRMLKEFVAAKGKIDEKMEQVDKRIAEFSQIRKELKKEIYNESLSGVQERVKDIVAGIEERFDASRDEMESKISELMKSSDARIKETESNLIGFRVELEKTVGKLRTDVDKVTVKKADEINKIAAGIRKDFEDKAEIVNAEIFQNFEQMKSEIAAVRTELAKSATFVRKEFETGELKRNDKTEKAKLALDKEFRLKLDDFTAKSEARTKTIENDMKMLRSEIVAVVDRLRTEVDKVTGKKTGELDRVVGKLRVDVEATVKAITDELSQNLFAIKNDVALVRKEFDMGETKRADKIDKTRSAIEREFKVKFDEYASVLDNRVKAIETDIKTVNSGLVNITSQLKDKFDDIIAEKTDSFEVSMGETTEKAEKARKDVEVLAENLKSKFQAGELGRRREAEKYLKELMVIKGEMTRRMKEADDQLRKFSDMRISIKNELMKETTLMVNGKLASLDVSKKREMTDSRKSLKAEIDELHVFLNSVTEKIGRLNDKLEGIKEDIFTVKKSRTLLVDNIKSLGRTIDGNNDVKMGNFLKEMDKRMKTQEQIINARMAELEKRMITVSDHAAKTKKEKEEELDELLKHVES
jgi:chromosome segregation ATPase